MLSQSSDSQPPAANPLREGLDAEPVPEPCAVVIFGASGDLAHRKLVPALYQLHLARRLPSAFALVGFARTPMTDDAFRDSMREATGAGADFPPWQSFARQHRYCAGGYDDLPAYHRLASLLEDLEEQEGAGRNRIFYLATPPGAAPAIVNCLAESGLARGEGWSRIVIEKPFGRDLQSARELNALLGTVFREEQIYRIDHYLGKDTVQNILVLRFANGIFEPIWNRRYVDHVQIAVAESLGVEERGAYYEHAGALRDMIQNHLLQLVCLVAMEPPVTRDERSIRNEKYKVLQAVRRVSPEDVERVAARGQYGPGWIAGQAVPAYRAEERVDPASRRDTFAALRLELDNWRWAGVPFYLRSGKRLPKRVSEIAVRFRCAPQPLFSDVPDAQLEPNVMTLRIQPDEGISVKFDVKSPGTGLSLRPVTMDFRYGSAFGVPVPEAYERLLLDCILGDPALFARDDWIEKAWEIVTPVVAAWDAAPSAPELYAPGSWGPAAANRLIERDGRNWRHL
jgi:glucose-6-phosphate 1-dehydrogenase